LEEIYTDINPIIHNMQTQYDARNLKGYLDYKQFWDFLDK